MMPPSLRSHRLQTQQRPHCVQVLPNDQFGTAQKGVKVYQSMGVLALHGLSSALGDHSEAIYQESRLPRWKNIADFPM